MKKVLLAGNIIGSYRSQLIINYFSERNYDYMFTILPFNFILSDRKGFTFRIINFILKRFFIPLYYVFLIINCDIFIYLSMNSQHIWTIKVAKWMKKIVVFDFYLSRYLVSIENKKVGQQQGKTFEKEFDITCLKNSSKIIFLNQSERDFYLDILSYSVPPNRIEIISLKSPIRKKAKLLAFRNFNRQRIFNICWWGKASQLHGIENMLNGLKQLESIRTDFKVNLFENNRNRALHLAEQVNGLGFVVEINVHDSLTFVNGLEEYLVNNCDIALGSFGDTRMAKTVLMNKVVDTLSLGIPMVTQASEAIFEFGLNEDTLWIPENLSSSSISNTLNQLMEYNLIPNDFQKKTHMKFQNNFTSNSFEISFEKLLISVSGT